MSTTVQVTNVPATEVTVEDNTNIVVSVSDEAKIDVFLNEVGAVTYLQIKNNGTLVTGIPKSLNFIGAIVTNNTQNEVSVEFEGGVTSVNSRTGDVTLTKNDVGLDQVDNTSDLDKPISTATQLALDEKQDALVSGTNIKTINGETILGSGNLEITNPLVFINYVLI